MLKRGALTTAIISLMAKRGVRHLETGELIEPWEFMAGYETNQISPVLDLDELSTATKLELRSAKTVGNAVFHPVGSSKLTAQEAINALTKKRDAQAIQVLASQLIPVAAAEDLTAGRPKQFLDKRAKYILEEMQKEIS
jgi:hypothetical protein